MQPTATDTAAVETSAETPSSFFVLTVALQSREQRFLFPTFAAAKEQMDLLAPKIGERFSNDPEKRTHRITSACGEAVVEMSRVESARLIDEAAFHRLTKSDRARCREEAVDHAKILAEALAPALQAIALATAKGAA